MHIEGFELVSPRSSNLVLGAGAALVFQVIHGQPCVLSRFLLRFYYSVPGLSVFLRFAAVEKV